MQTPRTIPSEPASAAVGRPKKTARIVAQKIVREITARGLGPGQKLHSEHEMQAEYGVARGTLREALRFLELQGILNIRPGPGGGPTIGVPDPKQLASTLALLLQLVATPFRSIMELRLAIEPTMAALAAERADEEGIRAIAGAIDKLRGASGDAELFSTENRRFHDVIAWSSGNPVFGFLVTSLHWIADASRVGIPYTSEEMEYTLAASEQIYLAICAHEPERARARMQVFMRESSAALEKRYPEVMDKLVSWEDIEL